MTRCSNPNKHFCHADPNEIMIFLTFSAIKSFINLNLKLYIFCEGIYILPSVRTIQANDFFLCTSKQTLLSA